MITAQDFGDYTLADDSILDVQTITDAMMTTTQSLTELAIRFFVNLAACWVLVHCFYYRKSRRRDYYFTFMVFSTVFVIIALAAVNGLAPVYKLVEATSAHPHYALSWGTVGIMVLSNLLVIALIWVLESGKALNHTSAKLVLYDRIELIVPERREELIADLEKRIGLKVKNVEIGHVDFLKDAAFIKVYYTLEDGNTGSIDSLTRAKDYVG